MNVVVNLESRIDPAAARRLYQFLFDSPVWSDDHQDEPVEDEGDEVR